MKTIIVPAAILVVMAMSRHLPYFNRRVHSASAATSSQVCVELEQLSVDLFDIVQNGRVDELQPFSGSKLLNRQNSKGTTLLHAAVQSKNIDMLQFLLKENIIPINAQDSNNETALHISVKIGNTEAMAMLLSRGADDTIKNSEGNPPLHLLVQKDDCCEQLSKFVQHPFDINVKGANNSSIFHSIVEHDNLEALQLIFQVIHTRKLSVEHCFSSQNAIGTTAIHLAAMKGAYKVLDFMLLKAKEYFASRFKEILCIPDGRLNTPLHTAIEHGHKAVIDVLLKHGASPVAIKGEKLPPFHLACIQNKMDIVVAMVDSFGDAILHCRDFTGATPLHNTARCLSDDLFLFVANNGSDPNTQDNNGNTPLHVSVIHGNALRVQTLLDKGADPLIENKYGYNAFQVSIITHRLEALKVLANSEHAKTLRLAIDRNGHCPVHLALHHKFSQSLPILVSLLMSTTGSEIDSKLVTSKDGDGNYILHTAAKTGHVDSLRYLLSLSSSRYLLNGLNNKGFTPLHFAAQSECSDSVLELTDHGAIEQKSYSGDTPFMVACCQGNLETAKILNRISPYSKNEVNDDGDSALHLAARSKNVDIVIFCLDLGIDVVLNRSNESFFDIILLNSDAETAIAVLKHKRFEECIKTCCPDRPNPVLRIIELIPEAFQVVLDRCVTYSPLPSEHPDYSEEYNFKYLTLANQALPPSTHDEGKVGRSNDLKRQLSTEKIMRKENQYAVLNHLIKYKHKGYLVHPLIDTFLKLKWRRYATPYHVFRFLLFLLLATFLSVFVLVIPLTISSETIGDVIANVSSGDASDEVDFKPIIFRFLTLGLCFVNLLMWLFDLNASGLKCLKHAIAESTVWMYGLSLLFIFVFVIPWHGLNSPYFNEVGAIAIFLVWCTVALLLKPFDAVGTFISMMLTVTRNVLGVLMIAVVFILALAFPLYILVGTVEDLTYTTIGMSLLSIIASLNGEIDYGTFARLETMPDFPYTVLTIMFVCALTVVMPIVIINLLIGLAVGDIASIQREAILSQRSVEVRALTKVDKIVPKFFFNKFILQQTYTLYPNKNLWLRASKIVSNLWYEVYSSSTTETNQDNEPTNKENQKKIMDLESKLLKLAHVQAQQSEALERMETMLQTLLQRKDCI